MILTQCAVCATELGLTLGKKCGRCSTRYCGPACQEQHWKEGGHDKLCKKIKRSGGAEQYHADKKYTETVTVAVKKCAEDTKGQTCYICTQALHWKTKEGLVRGCSCRGTAGFVHVSCLAEQAKILYAEVEENNLGHEKMEAAMNRWSTCSLCEQEYQGVVRCALGWACWKTYVGRPETDVMLSSAMTELGNGLYHAKHYEDALLVRETGLSILQRVGASEPYILITKGNMACAYRELGRFDEANVLRQEVYSGTLKINGAEHYDTLREAFNYATSLERQDRLEEAMSLLRKTMPVARRVLGEDHDLTLSLRWIYANILSMNESTADLSEAVTTLESVAMSYKRVLGQAHPETPKVQSALQKARKKLAWAHASRDATDSYTRSHGSMLLAKGMASLELSELKDSVGL